MATKKQKAGYVIHTAAITTAVVGAGLAQIPGSDHVVIIPVQVGMVLVLAKIHGKKATDDVSVIAAFFGVASSIVGRAIAQLLVGWIPGFGNVVNAATAFVVTEILGWIAFNLFEDEA